MDETKTEKKRITLIIIFLYIVGAFLFLFWIGLCAIHYIFVVGGVLFILAGAITIHSAVKNMRRAPETSLSGIKKLLTVIILIELAYIVITPPPCTFLMSP